MTTRFTYDNVDIPFPSLMTQRAIDLLEERSNIEKFFRQYFVGPYYSKTTHTRGYVIRRLFEWTQSFTSFATKYNPHGCAPMYGGIAITQSQVQNTYPLDSEILSSFVFTYIQFNSDSLRNNSNHSLTVVSDINSQISSVATNYSV